MDKQTKSTYLVFEYAEHSLKGILEAKVQLQLESIKNIIHQLLQGVAYLHKNKIIHRDLKSTPDHLFSAANILYNNEGVIKIADFGLARQQIGNMFTTRVVTLWYRAPELLLGTEYKFIYSGTRQYSSKVDVWALGYAVISKLDVFLQSFLAENLYSEVCSHLNVGDTEARQLEILYSQLGTDLDTEWSEAKTLPLFPDLGPKRPSQPCLASTLRDKKIDDGSIEFIRSCLTYDPAKRPEAEESLAHPYFLARPPPCPNSEFLFV